MSRRQNPAHAMDRVMGRFRGPVDRWGRGGSSQPGGRGLPHSRSDRLPGRRTRRWTSRGFLKLRPARTVSCGFKASIWSGPTASGSGSINLCGPDCFGQGGGAADRGRPGRLGFNAVRFITDSDWGGALRRRPHDTRQLSAETRPPDFIAEAQAARHLRQSQLNVLTAATRLGDGVRDWKPLLIGKSATYFNPPDRAAKD